MKRLSKCINSPQKMPDSFYEALAVPDDTNNWQWGGYARDGLHSFIAWNAPENWNAHEVKVSEQDIEDGSYLYMISKGWSRTKPDIRQIKKG